MDEVFLSHASTDDVFVAELRRRLEAQGVPVWVDSRALRGGDGLRPEIEKAITEAAVLLAAEDLESIEATLELLSDPAAQERLRRSQDDVERGDALDEDEVRAMIAKRRTTEA